MAYSRWGGRGSGNWYTYWMIPPEGEKENRNNALFDICGVATFTAKQLREKLTQCLNEVHKKDLEGDISELKIYIDEFLKDVETEYS